MEAEQKARDLINKNYSQGHSFCQKTAIMTTYMTLLIEVCKDIKSMRTNLNSKDYKEDDIKVTVGRLFYWDEVTDELIKIMQNTK